MIRVKEIRKSKGMRQKELAEKSSLSQSFLSQVEKGGRRPSLRTLEKLASVLGVTVVELIDKSVV